MPQGMQIWDGAGNLIMDTSSWAGQVLGHFTLAAPHTAGSLVDANLSGNRPWVIVLPNKGNEGSQPAGNPTSDAITITGGNTLNWNASGRSVQVIYGIY